MKSLRPTQVLKSNKGNKYDLVKIIMKLFLFTNWCTRELL